MKNDIERLATALMKEEGKEAGLAGAFIPPLVAAGCVLAVSLWFGGVITRLFVFAGLFGLIIFGLLVWAHNLPYKKRAAGLILVQHSLQHRPALRRNLARAFKLNDYGAVITDKRSKVVEEFAQSIGFPTGLLTPIEMLGVIEKSLGDAATSDASRGGDLDMVPADPILFEQWVADKLKIKGWDVVVTPASGDQGIDVIARKDGVSVGIQCKLYTGAVSNTAVQEVIAGAMYHGLTKGAVLTNAKYTQSAINLAASAKVVLMSHYDLSDPDRKLL